MKHSLFLAILLTAPAAYPAIPYTTATESAIPPPVHPRWSASPPTRLAGAGTASPAQIDLSGDHTLSAWLQAGQLHASRDRDGRALDPHAGAAPPSLAALLDGGGLVAYRRREADGNFLPAIVRLRADGTWGRPHDIDAEPESASTDATAGPRIAADGGRVAAVWAAGAGAEERVSVTLSPDAGARFLLSVSASREHPGGRPALALLHDGAIAVVWIGSASPPTLWFRRLSPDLVPGPSLALGDVAADAIPKMTLLRDYSGASTPARVRVDAGGRSFVVSFEEGALLAAAADDCRCSPTLAQLAGYPIRGTIAASDPKSGLLTVNIDAAPGVLSAGPHSFRAAPAVLDAARPGRDCLARIERSADGSWTLFDLRLLESPGP